jgi:hypothetical protein
MCHGDLLEATDAPAVCDAREKNLRRHNRQRRCECAGGAFRTRGVTHALDSFSEAEDSSHHADELRAGAEDDHDEIPNSQHTAGQKLSPALQAGPQPEEEGEAPSNEEEVAGGGDHRKLTGSEVSCRQQQTQLPHSCHDEIADEEVCVVPEGGGDASRAEHPGVVSPRQDDDGYVGQGL